MGWSSQFFTTIIIEGNTPQTGIFIYNGTPALGNLIGSWTTSAGTDPFGNTYPAGLNVFQGQLTGVALTNVTATVMSIMASTIANSQLTNNQISGGQILETTIIFDSGGGFLFGYTSTTTTVTQNTPGTYNFTALSTSATITVWGSSQGGDGGSTSQGGSGGNGGECAQEPTYPLVNGQSYQYIVAAGGGASNTGAGHGGDGAPSFFDINGIGGGVFANGGTSVGPGTGSTNTVHFDGGTGGAASGFGGGASGGNSGNSTAKGNNGLSSTSNTHAGAPAAQTGSGTGGAGSDSGTGPASSGGTPGGGGGGAGKGSGTPQNLTKSYEAQFTASFYGPDANASVANKTRSTTTMYQGGETAGGGGFNGNQRSVMVFNSNQIASDFAGYTGTNAQIELTCNHSWYNSGMLIDFDVPNSGGKVTSPPSTWPDDVNQTFTFSIVEGQTKTFTLGATVAQDFISNLINFLAIGGFVAPLVPYDLSYYGYFTGGHGLAPHPVLTISGTTNAAGSNTSGQGGNGQVVITYSTSKVMTFALAPQSGTDPSSNAFAAGYTGPVSAIQPGSSPAVVETWHTMTLTNGWTVGSGGYAQYKLQSNNTVAIRAENLTPGTLTNGTSIWTPPTGYVPTKATQPISAIVRSSTALGTIPRLEVTSTPTLVIQDFQATANALYFNDSYALD